MKPVYHFDTETYQFGPGNQAPKPVCYSVEDESGSRLLDRETGYQWLGDKLERAANGDALIAAHNAAFDLRCVLQHKPAYAPLIWRAYEKGSIRCTVIREKLLDIADGTLRGAYDLEGNWKSYEYSLESLAANYFKAKLDKGADSWRMRYGTLDGIPVERWPERARTYPIDDVKYLSALYRTQRDRQRSTGYTMPTEDLETRADFALGLTSAWGIRTDGERVHDLDVRTRARMMELSEVLIEAKIVRGQRDLFGELGTMTKDMKRIKRLIEATWPAELGKVPETEKGALKTGKEILELCDHPALEALIEFNSLQKSGSTYVEALKKGIDAPIHAYFDTLGAASARSSCRGPNLQNQPRLPGVRECFIPRAGHVFVACDYTAQEMRTFAQAQLDLTGESLLARRFNERADFDPHLEYAADKKLMIDLISAYARYAATQLGASDPELEEMRQRAKIPNFGLPGGMGIPGLMRFAKNSYGVKLSPSEAKTEIASWKDKWKTDAYFRVIRNIVGEANYGQVVIPQSGFRRGGCAYTDAANTEFQTLAAHCTKAAAFEVSRRCYLVTTSWLYGARIVNMVHDELILEVAEEWAHEAAMELREIMIEHMQKFTPKVPAAASATVMRRWSKKAKAIYGSDGRLVPWDAPRKAA